ncbi:MAG: tRNA uridine-5-carboxymethylaminomethyl(34) synthesis GTPase MnmE [Selenomonadaceae bacterium]|nr:tRNA uridine-5-carboxymethylaminomethyl(34) synthesis GTPase MnmE [Selenomonadaceae bacterium]
MKEDTIAAVATGRGVAGIGIVRISGSNAFNIVKQCFKSKRTIDWDNIRGYNAFYGKVVDEGEDIDEAIVLAMKGPFSYTGEDVVEVQCHGGFAALSKVLSIVYKNGAKPAERGEFTKRAFLNGRIDLTKAEAVMDIVSAGTERSRKSALMQLSGRLSEKVGELKEKIVKEIAELEAAIDFPEEMEDEKTIDNVEKNVSDIINEVDNLIDTYHEGKILKDGLKTAIIGRPNVGKSSLLNALTREDRAIVSSIPGTTRDFLEAEINIDGIPLILIDTAGIREAEDEIEHIGVKLAKKRAEEAELILAVFDASEDLNEEDEDIFSLLNEDNTIFIINKTDKKCNDESIKKHILSKFKNARIAEISAKNLTGLQNLTDKIKEFAKVDDNSSRVLVKNERVRNSLVSVKNSLESSLKAAKDGMPEDFIVIDLRGALNSLGEITGETLDEKIIDRIFEDFCIGK